MAPRRLQWVPDADRAALAADGWDVVDFDVVRREVVDPAARVGPERRTMATPAAAWLARVERARGGLAVLGVALGDLAALRALHGYVLEPAWRAEVPLLVQTPDRLRTLDPARFTDAPFAFPYTLERAVHAAHALYAEAPVRPVREVPPAAVALDPEQQRAVDAHEGVVQVIAPAGSGKTTVLVARVRELLRRGVPAAEILCTTFNRAAARELQTRLAAAGLGAVVARTFHGLGLDIVRDLGIGRAEQGRGLSLGQWRRLAKVGLDATGTWIEPPELRERIGDVKLGLLLTPEELRARAGEVEDGATLAAVYAEYERMLAAVGANDFDDQILLAVRALRDPAVRARWQARFTQVLVDEHQDIEPAQELLVRTLAAPGDGLFCVGDEDQTLYGWRRASVRRTIGLDLDYPGLERISLAHNYRCPPEVVAASRALVEHNAIRFPKAIHAAPGRAPGGEATIRLVETATRAEAATTIAQGLARRRPGEVVVLARTTNLLRTVALACADLGVRVAAPEAVFRPQGARRALEAYLRLCGAPGRARPEDVATAFRVPSRRLPRDAEDRVAGALRAGCSFAAALADLPVGDERQRARLDDAARVLDRLTRMDDAGRFVAHLRSAGGLDDHFAQHESTFGGAEQIELETLEQAQAEARGRTVAAYLAVLEQRTEALAEIRDDEGGMELVTIHGAKGRQWPRVELFGCEEGQLPHRRAYEATDEQRRAGDGIEAERRLAYVAFTRAQEQLVVSLVGTAASRFLTEAGLTPSRPWQPPVDRPAATFRPVERERRVVRARPAPPPPQRRATPVAGPQGPLEQGLATAQRVGLDPALRAAAGREDALLLAAEALRQRLVGARTTSQGMSIAKLLAAIEALSDAERAAVVAGTGLNEQFLVARLNPGQARTLERALRAAAG